MPAVAEAVMRTVLRDARHWADRGFTFRVAMNCAPQELLDGKFLPLLFDALDRADLPEDTLLVEVTEDTLLAHPDRARAALQSLRAHHVQTAINAYGTGFSLLEDLEDLPVQELKIDRYFIASLRDTARSRRIVQIATQRAHALGLRTVAVGVEDRDVASLLLPLGVDALQGFHIARPMPADEIAGWMRDWSSRTRALWSPGPCRPTA
jgi:EAL domain-containing protein (putative c-di-GMP-specific phosphodiesterase class I)